MLKEVGASGQISLGKKYAGQLFELEAMPDGSIVMRPVKVVPVTHSVQEERADYNTATATPASGDGWRSPERLARRAAAAARNPAEMESARDKWETDNKDAIEAMNRRLEKIGSTAQRLHEWRTNRASSAASTSTAASTAGG